MATQYFTPYHCFAVNGAGALMLMIEGARTSEELETNEFAMMDEVNS